ncbi:MAG: hypothetical protein ACI4SL_09040 [Candidatus Ornithospirochaeta sp.]
MMMNQYEVKVWLKDGVDIESAVDFIKDVFWRVDEENFILMGQILTITANSEDEFSDISLGILDLDEQPEFIRCNIKHWWRFYRDEPWEDENLLECDICED